MCCSDRSSERVGDTPLFTVLLSLLLLAALKDDVAQIEIGDLITEIVAHPLVGFLKGHVTLIAGLAILTAVGASALSSHYRFSLPFASALVVSLPLYAGLRGAFEADGVGLKAFQGAAMFLAISCFIAYRRWNVGIPRTVGSVVSACRCFAVVIVSLNAFTYLTGHGFVEGAERFFGTTIHPNFIGAQLGLCGIVLFHAAANASRAWRPIAALLAVFSLFLLVLSGSRTGLLILGAGGYFGIWRFCTPRLKLALVLAGCGLAVLALTSGWAPSDDLLTTYDRGGEVNTRADAWGYLLDQILEQPVFGQGAFVGFSENSLLRGWASFGFAYFLIMSSVIVLSVVQVERLSAAKSSMVRDLSLIRGLLHGLLAGAIFEGYLCDTLSVPVLLFVMLVATIGLLRLPMPTAKTGGPPRRGAFVIPPFRSAALPGDRNSVRWQRR